MTGFASTFVLAMMLAGAHAEMRRREDPPKDTAGLYPDRDSNKKCEELCKVDAGMDADPRDCLTECAVSTDLHTHHLDEGMHYFANDESYNEKGGKKIKDLHNEKAPEEVAECTPLVDLSKKPEFKDLDTNDDGVIDWEESEEWAGRACIPDEMQTQVFQEADLNQDKVIDKKEWTSAGEHTWMEKNMDKALEKTSQGDDEYNSVQNPPLEEFDADKDGALDKNEMTEVVQHEMERRTESATVAPETMKELEPEIEDAIDKVDTNDDGKIDAAEYTKEDEDTDMGTELSEAANADEDKPELEDLSRVPAGPDGAVKLMQLQSRHFLQHRQAIDALHSRHFQQFQSDHFLHHREAH